MTSAPNCNYTILTKPGQGARGFADQPASTSYTYITGDFIRVLIDARDEFDNLRFDSETEVFQVVLTGQATGADVSGAAVAMGNGYYVADLQFTLAEPYDLSIQLDAATADIHDSPLLNRILVKPGLVQAAHTHLVTTADPLTAGVSYTFEIRAKDIYENTVVGSEDYIDFQLRGPDGQEATETAAEMEYLFQLYAATFTLLKKGDYTGIITVTQRHGLLATYYETIGFSAPVLL